MKSVLLAQGWNFVLVFSAVVVGWFFPYEMGWIYNGFSSAVSWVDGTSLVGILFGIPALAVLLLSAIGHRWWYVWTVLIYLPTSWLFFSTGEFYGWLYSSVPLLVLFGIGLGARALLKQFFPSLFIFR